MEGKDGSTGLDFARTYTRATENELIEYTFGNRTATIDFLPEGDHTRVRVLFDPNAEYPIEQQRGGCLAILENLRRHVEAC